MNKRHLRMTIRSNLSLACTLETDLLQNTNGNDEVIIIVDIRRIQKKKARPKIVPMPSKGDLDFLCDCSVAVAHLHPWTHVSILGPRNFG